MSYLENYQLQIIVFASLINNVAIRYVNKGTLFKRFYYTAPHRICQKFSGPAFSGTLGMLPITSSLRKGIVSRDVIQIWSSPCLQ